MANEKRLISAELLVATCEEIAKHEWNKRAAPVSWSDAYEGFVDTINEMPTVDAVEVVFCEACVSSRKTEREGVLFCNNCLGIGRCVTPRDYCSEGKRRTDG